MRSKETAAKS
jgi:hypothetical protein